MPAPDRSFDPASTPPGDDLATFDAHRFAGVAELAGLDAPQDPARRLRIVHCVNPFPAKPGSEHDRAQRVTLASMREARRVAELTRPGLEIRHVAVALPGEAPQDAQDFDEVLTLDRSVGDLREFRIPRALPLIHDILSAPRLPDDAALIYTNIDIAVMEGFYGFIADLFAREVDAAVINRRTIAGTYAGPEQLALMRAETGAPHPGFDCFAFRAGLRERFEPWNSCVGIGGVMLPFLYNLMAVAEAPYVLLDAHVTFHIGDDQTWRNPELEDYAAFNHDEIGRVFAALCRDPERRARLASALDRGCPDWIFPARLRAMAGLPAPPRAPLHRRALNRLRRLAARASR